jgi:hypothetical protein
MFIGNRRFSMKLVAAMSMAALVLAPAVGLAQDNPANDAGNTKEQPGLVDKVIGTITGRSPDTKKGASADANKSGDPNAKASGASGNTDYPDRASIKTGW